MWRVFGLFGQEHPDAWKIEVWPGTRQAAEYVEDDVLVKVGEPGWCWAVWKNESFVTFGETVEENEALDEAKLAVKMLRLAP